MKYAVLFVFTLSHSFFACEPQKNRQLTVLQIACGNLKAYQKDLKTKLFEQCILIAQTGLQRCPECVQKESLKLYSTSLGLYATIAKGINNYLVLGQVL